ncbi:MAG: hypothetical protein ACLGJC_00165 [Alphaproteobacteria bacterium]
MKNMLQCSEGGGRQFSTGQLVCATVLPETCQNMTALFTQKIGEGDHVKFAEICSDYCVFSDRSLVSTEF